MATFTGGYYDLDGELRWFNMICGDPMCVECDSRWFHHGRGWTLIAFVNPGFPWFYRKWDFPLWLISLVPELDVPSSQLVGSKRSVNIWVSVFATQLLPNQMGFQSVCRSGWWFQHHVCHILSNPYQSTIILNDNHACSKDWNQKLWSHLSYLQRPLNSNLQKKIQKVKLP